MTPDRSTPRPELPADVCPVIGGYFDWMEMVTPEPWAKELLEPQRASLRGTRASVEVSQARLFAIASFAVMRFAGMATTLTGKLAEGEKLKDLPFIDSVRAAYVGMAQAAAVGDIVVDAGVRMIERLEVPMESLGPAVDARQRWQAVMQGSGQPGMLPGITSEIAAHWMQIGAAFNQQAQQDGRYVPAALAANASAAVWGAAAACAWAAATGASDPGEDLMPLIKQGALGAALSVSTHIEVGRLTVLAMSGGDEQDQVTVMGQWRDLVEFAAGLLTPLREVEG
jgi:hypothetical protein